MKHDALSLVQRSHEPADLDTHDALERHALGRDHVNVDPARTQRRRHFQADEARARDHDMLGVLRALDNRAAVGERAQIHHLIAGGAWNRQPHGIRAGGED